MKSNRTGWILNNSISDVSYRANLPTLSNDELLYCIMNETRKSSLACLLREARRRKLDITKQPRRVLN